MLQPLPADGWSRTRAVVRSAAYRWPSPIILLKITAATLRKQNATTRLNYNKLEEALQSAGELTLPAAIVLQAGNEALLFSGYRRLCLAWNYGMTPFVWLVPL